MEPPNDAFDRCVDVFDGQGKKIKNLESLPLTKRYVGVFRYITYYVEY